MLTEKEKIAVLSSSYYFIIKFFKDPHNPSENFKPYKDQIQIYDYIDFGWDLHNKVIRPGTEYGLDGTYENPINRIPEIVIMKWPRQRGKTEGVASLCGALIIRHSNCDIGVISNSQDNAEKLIKRIKFFIESSPFKNMVEVSKVDRVIMKNGSGAYSFGQTENVKGNSFTWLIIDEAAQSTDELIDGAALPTVDAAGAYYKFGTPSVIMLSTPRGAKGRYIEYYFKAMSSRKVGCRTCKCIFEPIEFKHVTKWPEWKMPDNIGKCPKCGGLEYEYVDGDLGIVVINPWDHPYKSKADIQRQLDLRGNTPLAREAILGEIISAGSIVFSEEWLITCSDPSNHNYVDPNPNYDYCIGVDFGKLHDATVISVGHKDANTNKTVLDYLEVINGRGLLYSDIRYRVLKMVDAYIPTLLVLDANGIGDPIVEQINLDLKNLYINGLDVEYRKKKYHLNINRDVHTTIYSNKKNRLGFVTEKRSKIDLIDNLVNLFQRELISIPEAREPGGIKTMWEEFINFGYDHTPNNNIKYGTQRGHDDTVIAVALMAWGLREPPWYSVQPLIGGEDYFVLSDDI